MTDESKPQGEPNRAASDSPWGDRNYPGVRLTVVPDRSYHGTYPAPLPEALQREIDLADEAHDRASHAAFKIWLQEMVTVACVIVIVALLGYFGLQFLR